MKRKILLTALPVIAIILELLPYGAVLNFALPSTIGTVGRFRETYSYFSLMPFGYGNFGPFLTAICSCLLLIFTLIYIFSGKCRTAVRSFSIAACTASIMPLMFGLSFFSVVGAIITATLAADIALAFIFTKALPHNA